MHISSQSGQTLVELLVAIGLSAVLVPALLTGLVTSHDGKAQAAQRQQAVTVLQQANDAFRVIREKGWSTIATNGTYYPQIVNNSWSLATGSATINGMTESIIIGDINRDSNGYIATTGGTLDPATKKITTTVSWSTPTNASLQSISYVTRYLNNTTNTQTTIADFNTGTNTGTVVATTSGSQIPNDGQVDLGAGGAGGNWCQPGNSVLNTYNLPGQGVVQAISATSSAARYAYAYTTTGGNASGDAVDGLTIDNNPNPPSITNPTNNTEAKAYGIYVDNNNNYIYFNENNPPNHTVRIARTSDLSNVGYFDVSHITGSSVFVSGNTGYTISGNTLYSFDVTTIKGSSSQTQLGSITLDGTGNRIVVVGTNAYVATSNTTKQLDIINVSDPTNMSLTKSINLGNGQGAVDVFVNGTQTYAYIVTPYTSGQNDFFIVDLNNTSNIYGYSTLIQSGNSGAGSMSPKAIAVVTGNRAIIVGCNGGSCPISSTGWLYQVFNVTTPSSAVLCGGMSPSGVTNISAIAPIYQGGIAYAYILTDNANAEFQIVLGGSGGSYASSGTFLSSVFDPGFPVQYNSFSANIAQPVKTSIKMQVGIAAPFNNSCNQATYTYVGPDGTTSTYYIPSATSSAISGMIPYLINGSYQNPAECYRYKVYESTSDMLQTPVLYDETVNYSP